MRDPASHFLWAALVLCCTAFAYAVGRDTESALAIRAAENAVYAHELRERQSQTLAECVATQERTMSVVLETDAELHDRLAQLPPVVLGDR